MTQNYRIRLLQNSDDSDIAAVIRTVMPEFGADGPGFAIHDPEVDAMHAAYTATRTVYFVVECGGAVKGGAGIGPLAGLQGETCELRKMYFLPELRGLGVGRALMDRCLQTARELGYQQCYIETLTGMDSAQALYLKSGFRRIDKHMGETGHFGCDRFFLRNL